MAEEQKLALRHVSGAAAVNVLEAGAGTGKTTTAKALTEIARRCELQVIGLAPSWVAADELRSSTGIPAQAIAKWRHDHAQGAGTSLGPNSLMLVDEAGMVGTKDLAAILSRRRPAVPAWCWWVIGASSPRWRERVLCGR